MGEKSIDFLVGSILAKLENQEISLNSLTSVLEKYCDRITKMEKNIAMMFQDIQDLQQDRETFLKNWTALLLIIFSGFFGIIASKLIEIFWR